MGPLCSGTWPGRPLAAPYFATRSCLPLQTEFDLGFWVQDLIVELSCPDFVPPASPSPYPDYAGFSNPVSTTKRSARSVKAIAIGVPCLVSREQWHACRQRLRSLGCRQARTGSRTPTSAA